ncbi:hypothetical protein PCE1_004110 [Barthelona sp. PCE]
MTDKSNNKRTAFGRKFLFASEGNVYTEMMGILALVLSMIAMFTKNKALCWVGLFCSISASLNKSNATQQTSTTIAQLPFSIMSLIMTYFGKGMNFKQPGTG